MKYLDPTYIHSFRKELAREIDRRYPLSDPLKPAEEIIALYTFYEQYDANISSLGEIQSGLTRNTNDEDTTFALGVYFDSDENVYNLNIGFYSEEIKIDFQRLGELLKKKINDINEIIEGMSGGEWHRPKNEIYNKLHDSGCKGRYESTIKLNFLTNVIPTKAERKKLTNSLTEEKITFIYGDEIEYEIMQIDDPKEFVDTGILVLNEPENMLRYEKSRIVSISAFSLKNLYEQYHYRGLFAQNIRYYVKKANVDTAIVDTIRNHPEQFWYFNNGIIIICDDYKVIGSKIILSKFSIINGGQTTKLIGESEFNTDFFISCKILVCPEKLINDKLNFIADVAAASNTQKPISATDLVANRVEQREMKKYLADNGICYRIKRGEKTNKKLYPKDWQSATNERVAQLMLSFLHQLPGTARNSKGKIFAKDELYRQIFVGVRHNAGLIADLLKVYWAIEQWPIESFGKIAVGLVKNGLFWLIAQIGAAYKLYISEEFASKVLSQETSVDRRTLLSHCDVDHSIFNFDDNAFEDTLQPLLNLCMKRFFRPAYETYAETQANPSYSNFTKLDSNYLKYLLPVIVEYFGNTIPSADKAIFDACFRQPDDLERLRDERLFRDHPITYVPTTRSSGEDKKLVNAVRDALATRKPKPQVNVSVIKDLLAHPPKSLADLRTHGVKEKAIASAGDFIIETIQEVLERKETGDDDITQN